MRSFYPIAFRAALRTTTTKPTRPSFPPSSTLHNKNNKQQQQQKQKQSSRFFTTTTPTAMALPPKFAGHRLVFSTPAATGPVPPTQHTLELYLDYVCPFSARQFATVYGVVAPLVRANPAWAGKLQIVFRPQVQPWHPSSTLAHEAGVAVLRTAPDRFWAFSEALFARQKEFFDVAVVAETRNQTYRRLADLAATVGGVDVDAVYRLLEIADKPAPDGGLNTGNAVTNDLKVLIKMARLVGIHVSPTVVFDGVVANDISSGWTKEQWVEWLTKNIS